MRRPRLLSGTTLLFTLCLPAVAAAQAPRAELRLRPGDAVRLAVRDEPGLTGQFPVVASGQVMLPEIGMVAVAGRPFAEVTRQVRAAYGRIVVDEDVELVPVLRIAVLGEVRQPGLLDVDPTRSVADVLASAGGVAPTGDPKHIFLVHEGRTTRLSLSPDTPALSQGLVSGDRIVVGRRGWMRENLAIVVGASASVLAAAVTSLIVR
ncbi:MAG TPA: polysaccharide biosynthesis/export family protein [Longimicrobiaceae bacterium]|nr:polysaccharide biosynthesis/export family protein [Longimicrobiaceae bacterium]